ncbi:TlpA family protein disulfide reductase [Azospirillum rugosum]|uniref:Thiol-disulfide isomerase/thioredoxin n=1 Tax=Azospirillum rugosum TaxID=416170 RepID=A0ABS4SKG5_9PROT|nr:TlpA disulfide reductase family protein [Azospirillum rugosum]MBP2292583.1 thiol-disulfide isomerase/thioredoxin [Azospirillum rugosum]MDQ0526393.1 thiol-disulfide isomerase/thioredoxin [Azospirillum rugosum]
MSLAGGGLWAALAGPSAPPVTVLGKPGGAEPGVAMVGLDKYRSAEAPKPMPPLSFLDGEGRRVDVSEFKDKLVLLNLWATWCAPCVKEMPALDRLQAQLGGEGFQVVALSVDRGGKDQVQPFYQKIGVSNLGLYLDPSSSSMQALSLRGLPTTLLVDQEGRELGRIEGAVEWDSPEVVAFLRKHMGRGSGPARDTRGGVLKTGG